MHRKLTAWWADSHRHHVAALRVSAEQYCLGAAFGSCKITLLRTIRIEIQDPLICDIGVFAAHARWSHQLLRGKQDHLATWRSGWNLNYKGVKLKTKSMSPLKPDWPFSFASFWSSTDRVPGTAGVRALPGPWPSAGGWAQLIICMVQLGAIFQFSLTRIQASFCRHKEANSPEVQFVLQCNLLLSHPWRTAPPPLLSRPCLFSCL